MHRLSRDGKLHAHHALIPHNALSDARAIVSYVAGDDQVKHFGVTEREMFMGLWRAGYPFDRRDVLVAWDTAEGFGIKGAIATLAPTHNHKTLSGSIQVMMPEKLQNSGYSGGETPKWAHMVVLYLPRVAAALNVMDIAQHSQRLAR
jgi:hypothetical protein